MAAFVYVLCTILSLACGMLLLRAYRRSSFRLLFWSAMGFFGFLLNNILLLIDLMTPKEQIDLSIIRTIPALIGMMIMMYGLISDSVQE